MTTWLTVYDFYCIGARIGILMNVCVGAMHTSSIDKAKALSLIVHCADISHPAKPWNLHLRWTEQLVEEFYKQVNGDLYINKLKHLVDLLQYTVHPYE